MTVRDAVVFAWLRRGLAGAACLLALAFAAPSAASVSYVARATAVTAGGGGAASLAVAVPAGTANGDVMLAQVTVRGGSGTTITAPAGWTLIRQDTRGVVLRQALYWRVAAAEPASHTFGFSASVRAAAAILTYRGVDATVPIDASNGQNSASSTSVTAPAVATTFSDAWVAGFFSTAAASSFTPPGGMTERHDAATTAGPNGVTIEGADQQQNTPGSSGARTATAANAAENIGALVALKPAALLRADWHFDECSYSGAAGEVLDSSGNGFNATARNSLATSAPGRMNRYGAFEASYSRWAQTALALGRDWTLSVWFQAPFIAAGASQYYIIGSVAGGSDLLYLDRNNNYRWGVYTLAGTTDGTFQFGTLSAGWHHMVLVGQGGTTRLYIDGALRDSVARKASGTLTYLGTSFDGVNTANAQGWRTQTDEYMVWDYVLNAAQITSIYNNQLAGNNYDGTVRPASTCVDHYALTGTAAGTICTPSTVTITAHQNGHGAVNPAVGTTLNLTTSTGSGLWGVTVVSGGGTWTPSGSNNGQAVYVWPGGESSVTLQLGHATATTLNVNLSDTNAKTEAGSEDPNFVFAAGCVGHYAVTGTTAGTLCAPSTVTITAHNNGHPVLIPAAGTTLALTTSTGTGQWGATVVAGGGTWTPSGSNNGQATYVWPGGESSVTLQISHATVATLSVNLADNNAKTEDGTEDPNFTFAAGCVGHYALSGTTSGTVCDPSQVTITAHNPLHAGVNPSAGTTLSLNTSTATGVWGATVVAGTGTWTPSGLNNGQATYVFPGTEGSVTLRLNHATATTLSVNVLDGSLKNESPAEDPNFVFNAACVAHYALSGTTAGLTCAPSTVVITAHNPSHAAVNPAATTTLALTTSTGTAQWGATVVAGSGTWTPSGSNNGQATYVWPGGESSVTLQLNDAAIESLSVNLADGSGKAEAGAEDPVFSFVSTGCVNHYAISGMTAGLTCEPSQVTISAHTGAHAAVNPTAGTTLALNTSTATGVWAGLVAGGGVYTPSGANNGQATYVWPGAESSVTLLLRHVTPVSLSVNVLDSNGRAESEDPAFAFADTGFRIASNATTGASIGTQLSGKDSNVGFGAETRYLQAVRRSPDTAGCTGGFQNQTVVVDLATRCETPSSCVPASRLAVRDSASAWVNIANNNGGAAPASYTGVSLAFDADSKAPLVHNFPDAGQIMLFARYALPAPPAGAYMEGSSNAFVVRPLGLAIRGANAASAVQHGTTSVSPLLAAAGDNFTLTVAGYRWSAADDADNDGLADAAANLADNGLTPNFAWATTLTASGNLPGIATGAITRQSTGTGTIAQGEFAGGAATVADWRYSEVGNVFLAAAASNYITAGISVSGNSGHDGSGAAGGYVGRFRPKHFRLDGVTPPTLANRAALLPGCASTFSYLDEAIRLSFKLVAENAQNVLTQNYTGAYAKLSPAAPAVFGFGARSGSTNLTPRVSALYPGAAPAWASGALDITTGNPVNLTVARAATPDGPYPGVQFGIAPVDSDGTAMAAYDLDVNSDATNDHTMVAGTTEARFGRLKFFNAFGSETLPLPMRYEAQYYDGAMSGFRTNLLDNCSSVAGRVGSGNYLFKAGAGPWSTTITVGAIAAGRGVLTLSPPGAGRSVRLDVAANLAVAAAVPTTCRAFSASVPGGAPAPAYLRNVCTGSSYDKDPIGSAVFGLHKNASEFIFMREMY